MIDGFLKGLSTAAPYFHSELRILEMGNDIISHGTKIKKDQTDCEIITARFSKAWRESSRNLFF